MKHTLVLAGKRFFSWYLTLLPLQTIWLYREYFVDGVKWEYATLGFFATQVLFWLSLCFFVAGILKEKGLPSGAALRETFVKMKQYPVFPFIEAIILGEALIVLLMIRAYFTVDPLVSMQFLGYLQQSVIGLLVIFFFYQKPKEVLHPLLHGAFFTGVVGIAQFLSQQTVSSTIFGLGEHIPTMPGTSVVVTEFGKRVMRAYGTFAHPNILGGYMAVMLLLVMLTEKKVSTLATFAPHIVVLCAALLVSFSRSAWIAVAALFLVQYMKKYVPPVTKMLSAIVLLMSLVFCIMYQDLVYTRTQFSSSAHEVASVEERVTGYEDAYFLAGQYASMGVGVGQFTYALQSYKPFLSIWEYQPVHNVPLLIVVEWGIWITISVVLIARFWFMEAKRLTKEFGFDHSIVLGTMLPLFVFDHYLYTSYTGIILVGIVAGTLLLKHKQMLFGNFSE